MDPVTCTQRIAEPIGTVGMSFYFSPQAIAIGETIELDVVAFYAGGRAGVLGDVPVVEVDEVFFFFKDGMVAQMAERARSIAEIDLTVQKHMEAAASFAEATFGAVPAEQLEAFSAAAERLSGLAPAGRWPIFDGYLALPVPTGTVARAYHWAVILRELRGGIHTDAVKAAGLSDVEAVQLDQGGAMLGLHGYADEDLSEVTDELLARRAEADAATEAGMVELVSQLDDAERQALVDASLAMAEALASPTPVS